MKLFDHCTHPGLFKWVLRGRISSFCDLLIVPEDQAVDLLVADPALLALFLDQLPLSAAGHVLLVPQYPSEDHATVRDLVISEVVDEGINTLPIYVLPDLDRFSCN